MLSETPSFSKLPSLISLDEEILNNQALLNPEVSPEGTSLDEELAENVDEENSLNQATNKNKPPKRRFGTQMGLFSKFTNAPTLDEFTLTTLLAKVAEQQKAEELPTIEELPELGPLRSMYTFKGSMYESPIATELVSQRKEFDTWYKFSIIAVIFSTQFAGALEIVYMSPLFSSMKLPPLLDATAWIFPVFFTTFVTPFVDILASHLQYERLTHVIIMLLSLTGCFIFAFLDQVLPLITTDREDMRLWTIYLGFLAFCLLDVSNEMTNLIQNKMVLADEALDSSFNDRISGMASFARIIAYLMGALQAFGVNFYNGIIPDNSDFGFLLAGIFLFASLIFTLLYQTNPTKGYRGPLVNKLKQLRPAHFLPPPRRIFRESVRLKLIILSHFFGSAGVLNMTVYATLWVGMNILHGNAKADKNTEAFRTFEDGVAWGSLCLMISAILSALTKYAIHKLSQPDTFSKRNIKILYVSSLFIGALAILTCKFNSSFSSCFIVVILNGCAFETFHVIPGMLGDWAEIEETGKHFGHYRHELGFSLFYAQVLMFLIVPLCFLLFPDRDDTLWGMLSAGASMLVGATIGLFI